MFLHYQYFIYQYRSYKTVINLSNLYNSNIDLVYKNKHTIHFNSLHTLHRPPIYFFIDPKSFLLFTFNYT